MRGPQQGRGILFVLGGAAVVSVVALAAGLWFDPRTILAPLEPARPAPAPSAGPAEPASDAKPQVAEPARAEAPPPPPAPGPESPPPSFDVVRVEPTGESVIAGRSVAGATVEMLRDGQVHARTAADQSGLFAFVPPPLQPGSHQVTLQSIAPDGTRQRSRDSVTIVVHDGGKTRPLVAMTSPDKPTVLLSNPEAPEPKAPEPQVAEAKPPEAKPPQAAAPDAKGPAGADPQSAASSPAPAPADTAQPDQPAPAQPQQQAGAQPPSPAPARPGAPASQEAPPPPPPAPAPPAPRPDVKIATVEAEEGGRLYVSGQAAPGSTVRLYLNETFIAPGGAGADGKVAFAIGRGVRPGDYRVRIDDVDPVSGAVKSRAEVAFNVPAPVVAALQDTPPPPSSQAPQASPRTAPAPQASPGRAATPERPSPPDASTAAAPPASSAPTASARPGTATDASPAGGSQVASATPPTANDFPPGTIVIPDVTTAIVSRGDNLWRISQRVYGKGVRYTVIYGANQRQIRNPNLIYPGQLFVLPEQEKP